MAGTVIADAIQAASTSQLNIKNGVALTPPTISDVNNVAIGTFCRAWVSFNGSGTIAIRASFNVSSITDVGTGSYRINFTNAMPDGNYVFAGNGQGSSSGSLGCNTIPFVSNSPASLVNPTTTSVDFTTWLFNYSTTFDPLFVTAAIFR